MQPEILRCKDALKSLAPEATYLHENITRLEETLEARDILGSLDSAKTLVETVLKTIIVDIRGPQDFARVSLPTLFDTVKSIVPLSAEVKAKEHLEKLCAELILKIGQIRNEYSADGHGRDGYTKPNLSEYETDFVCHLADIVSQFLYQIHKNAPNLHLHHRIQYEENQDYNDYLDGQFPSTEYQIGANGEMVIIKASEIFFRHQSEFYKAGLLEFKNIEAEDLAEDQDNSAEPIEEIGEAAHGTHH